MAHYEGPAHLERGDDSVEIQVMLESGTDGAGLEWWGGRFEVPMDGMIAMESMLQDVVTLRIGSEQSDVLVSEFNVSGIGAIGSLAGSGEPPTVLRGA